MLGFTDDGPALVPSTSARNGIMNESIEIGKGIRWRRIAFVHDVNDVPADVVASIAGAKQNSFQRGSINRPNSQVTTLFISNSK